MSSANIRFLIRLICAARRVPEYLQQRTQSLSAGVALIRGDVARGTVFQEGRLAIFGAEDLFESPDTVAKPGKSHLGTFSADQFDLKAGDYVVHVEHGIGQFLGIREIPQGDTKGDYMLIEYAGGNKLYVPLSRMDLVQRFRGEGESKPVLDKMGGATWNRTRTRIKTKMRDMAEELLKLYAARRLAPGFSFSPDSNWQREFEDAFEFSETRDQKTAIADIKRDMESPQPMDRLLCGDVGYGKTEVVMRAAFKAMGDGKQVAVLAPTTVFCFQHARLSRSAFSPSPCASKCSAASAARKKSRPCWTTSPKEKSTSWSARTASFRRTSQWKDLGPRHHRRRAALRREAQGAAQGNLQRHRRHRHERHPDPPHAAYVAARFARFIRDRDSAQGSARHSNRGGAVRRT